MPAPLDQVVPLLPVLCDRNRGLGSDGLLTFEPWSMTVRIFNPDSSEAQKSGNGLRIIAAHAVLDHSAGERFELHTQSATNHVTIHSQDGAEVVSEIDIGRPSFRAADLPARFEGEPDRVRLHTPAGDVEAMLVSVGNPHCVELGPVLERHDAFPERTNVQLFEVLHRGRVRIEIWERGAGYTLASGTSASAVAAACIRAGLVDDHVTIQMPGGDLQVRKETSGNLVQSGPARRVYRASIDLADF